MNTTSTTNPFKANVDRTSQTPYMGQHYLLLLLLLLQVFEETCFLASNKQWLE